MPGRYNDPEEYRYGFQGQEVDNEIKGPGNSVNYKFRMHDPRLGRFFAVDPLTAKYPHYSPYSFSGNKVIQFVELEGLEEGRAPIYESIDGYITAIDGAESGVIFNEAQYKLPTEFKLSDIKQEDLPDPGSIGLSYSQKIYQQNVKITTEVVDGLTPLVTITKLGSGKDVDGIDLLTEGAGIAGDAIKIGYKGVKTLLKITDGVSEINKISKNTRKFWKGTTYFQGIKVYQRSDNFNPKAISSWNIKVKGKKVKVTGTNVERMASGRAPIGIDGKPINLHHMIQSDAAGLAEMTQTFHKKNSKILHINPRTIPSGINRSQFATFKRNYWKQRAKDFK
ncbi:MAG: HNH/ENDO VII family nuclease [Flavobacteriales bacterium]|nr:HNH/ENDO VII family nuclease [Flavobacteriales bacterium]